MRLLTALIITLLIGGCSTLPQQTGQADKWSPEQYYSEARKAQVDGDHKMALKYFNELEILYPLSPYAQQAPLEMAYADYKLENLEQAVKESERFIATYPDHANLDYAYYLKGLALSGLGLGKATEQSAQTVIVDEGLARDAFKSFSTLVQKFPDSKYRDNAQQRMMEMRNLMAMNVLQGVKAKLAAGDHESALQMAKYISEQYSGTAAAAEAFELVTQASSTIVTPESKQSSVSQAISPPSSTPDSIHREAWLLQQDPQHFSLQIIGTNDKDNLENFIRRHQLEAGAAYFRTQFNNKDWYSLLYGNYATEATAITAAETLKVNLGLDNIWIRQFNDIQAQITKARQSGN